MKTPVIRPALPCDEERIVALGEQAGMGTLSGFEETLVACPEDGGIAGFCRIRTIEDVAYVNPIVVSEPLRGCGVGTALMRSACALHKELRFVARGSAVAFYRSLACEEIPGQTFIAASHATATNAQISNRATPFHAYANERRARVKSNRPVIGITADIDDSTNLCSINREYGESVWQAGGLPLIIEPVSTSSAYISTVLSRIDGVILSGGGDIDPAFYGQTRRARLSEVHPRRDAFEKELVARMHAADMPVLGICRGMQMMNVALGGTLTQDISLMRTHAPASCPKSTMPDDDTAAHQQSKPYEEPFHRVEIAENTLLWRLHRSQRISCDNQRTWNRARKPSCQANRQDNASAKSHDCENRRCLFVNSMHHQAIERIARKLVVSALCGSIVEAIEDPRKAFFLGVQWHPEYLDTGSALFEALCQAARKHHRKDLP